MFDHPLSSISITYWVMAAVVGFVKYAEAYRRPGTAGDGLLAAADGLTAIVVWRALSTMAIALYSVARTSSWGGWLPALPEEAFAAIAMLVALYGVREVMGFLMRFKIVRERVSDEKTDAA